MFYRETDAQVAFEFFFIELLNHIYNKRAADCID